MRYARALKNPALLCTLLLALCTLAAYPLAEIGSNDDFAYVRSAKALAETGHFIYFGWSSAMLGWQLAFGALFIKLFGFSFTATRASILFVALATTFLLQRTFVHLGLRQTNATFATLTLVLSPLFIPLSFSFMSDIPGFFAIVLSLYLCLRAIEAPLPSQATIWLIAAMVSSSILGTARQTGWLGILVIVPSACWILRNRRLSFVSLAIVWLLCVCFIFGCLSWFNRQMYTTIETSSGMAKDYTGIAIAAIRVPLELSLFLLPILIAFIFELTKENRRVVAVSFAGILLFTAFLFFRIHSYSVGLILAPAANGIGDYVTTVGTLELPAVGARPVVLQPAARAILTVFCDFSAFAFVVLLITKGLTKPVATSVAHPERLSWRQLFLLLGPLTLAYCVFLGLRILSGSMFDRYLLPLLLVLAFVALYFYQERISSRLPRICFVVLFLFAAYGVAGTHDMFAADRARLAIIQQLRATGLSRTSFYGGFGYDGWTQIDSQGYIDADEIHTPAGTNHLPPWRHRFQPCGYWPAQYLPAIQPQYVVSYDNSTCDPQNRFAPVSYRLWLPPFSSYLYARAVSPGRVAELTSSTTHAP